MYSSTGCQKLVETKRLTYLCVATVLRSNFHPMSLNRNVGLVPLSPACVIELDRFGSGSVIVWGGIMGGNKTRLIVINGNINAKTYINDVHVVEALSFIQFHCPNVTFMHDNAHLHSASTTRQFLATNYVNVFDWPVNNSDLNPIERVWD